MDYQALLKKYMQHVVSCEGNSFVGHIHDYSDSVQFTDAERRILEKMDEGIWDD